MILAHFPFICYNKRANATKKEGPMEPREYMRQALELARQAMEEGEVPSHISKNDRNNISNKNSVAL